jgi:hypothetical protein
VLQAIRRSDDLSDAAALRSGYERVPQMCVAVDESRYDDALGQGTFGRVIEEADALLGEFDMPLDEAAVHVDKTGNTSHALQ